MGLYQAAGLLGRAEFVLPTGVATWKLACHLSVVKVICEREEPVCPDFFCTAGVKREVSADSSQPQLYSKG